MTPLTYGVEDGDIIFSTWRNSDAVRNARRNGTASVLIDKADQPYAGVHYTGRAEVLGGGAGVLAQLLLEIEQALAEEAQLRRIHVLRLRHLDDFRLGQDLRFAGH